MKEVKIKDKEFNLEDKDAALVLIIQELVEVLKSGI